MTEVEPRRSVRATKGQHTKSFDELEQVPVIKKRQAKKTRKVQEKGQSQEPEANEDEPDEVIRCVCGATEQDEDSGEAWISCETCYAWQHNVCVGVSSFEDEIPDNYWCEECKPENHVELLEAIERGEKPWEARRKAHEEKKKKKGPRRSKGKRNSEQPEKIEKVERERTPKLSTKGRPSPAPEQAKSSPAPEAFKNPSKETSKPKRKSREDSQVSDGKPPKVRRVSQEPTPAKPKYSPPENLPTGIKDLPGLRKGPATALKKSILHVMTEMSKNQTLVVPEGGSVDSMAELAALQIERAVSDTHPIGKGQKEYTQQIKSLTFNLKNNAELIQGLMDGTHTPPTLAVMTTDQLASSELQRQTAELQAKVDKQSILPSHEQTGPRVRRTHKGDELVEDDNVMNNNDEPLPLPPGGVSRPATKDHLIKREAEGEHASPRGSIDQRSPSQPNFDIGKVFSSVRSPSVSQRRRPSAPAPIGGPGVDADVDRMLEDENDSPPYSPTEETSDPSIIWRGNLAMSSIADFPAIARHIGGANFASVGPWSNLIPQRMTVAGRIGQQDAIEYLCGLRYSNYTDVIVVNIEPAPHVPRDNFHAMIDYFISKKRYGVIGNKVAGNVRDTYLVPVMPGEGAHPEFMLNLMDNHIPKVRTEPMMLAVFVYRNDPSHIKTGTPPTPAGSNSATVRSSSISGPTISPATPTTQQTPVPIPQIPHATTTYSHRPPSHPQASQPQQQQQQQQTTEEQRKAAQQVGEAMAAEILGPQLITAATLQFILPQAWKMSRREWEVIKTLFEREPRARDDLNFLSVLLEREGRQ